MASCRVNYGSAGHSETPETSKQSRPERTPGLVSETIVRPVRVPGPFGLKTLLDVFDIPPDAVKLPSLSECANSASDAAGAEVSR